LKEDRKRADAIFRGTITEIRGTRVRFRVERVWKGKVTREFEMNGISGVAPFSFYPGQLEVGNDLLVFAARLSPEDPPNDLFNINCSHTHFASQRAAVIAKLGRGRKPSEK